MTRYHLPAHIPTCSKLLIAACASAIALSGCGRPDTAAESSSPASTPNSAAAKPEAGTPGNSDAFKAALITSGPTSDNGWNAGAYKGLQAVKQELSLSEGDVAIEENRTSDSDRDESLNGYASKKFNIIFAHGHEFQDKVATLAAQFPKTVFVVSSGEKGGANFTPIILKLSDGAYLEGMLAAGMSKTHILACVGAEKIPPVQDVFTAFEKGAKAVDPNVKVLEPAYTGSWDDVKKAKDQTAALLNQNADVIMQDVDAAAKGVFNAVEDASKSGKTVYALGTNNDQNSAAPDVILASAPIYIDKAFVPIAKSVKANTFKSSTTPYDLKSGVIGFVLNPQLADKIPVDLKKRLDEAQKKIIDGSLSI